MLPGPSKLTWWMLPLWGSLSLACAANVRGLGAGSARARDDATTARTSAASVFIADASPVTALAWDDPVLWIGSARGLRRVRFPAGDAEWIAADDGFPARQVTALAVTRPRRILIASEQGIGELTVEGGEKLRYQAIAALDNVTHLAASPSAVSSSSSSSSSSKDAGAAPDRIWAGTTKGLFIVEGGHATAVEAAGAVAITSLDVDADGVAAWVGTRGRGLMHVDAHQVFATFGPSGSDATATDLVDVVGTAAFRNGTRIAAGRGADGSARLVVLRLDAPVVLTAPAGLSPSLLVSAADGPVLFAQSETSTRGYALSLVERGESVADGSLRFVPARKSLQSIRVAARPLTPASPTALGEATVAIAVDDDVVVGTRASGVARVEPHAFAYVAAGDLVLGAETLSVACARADSCLIATGTGVVWSWDGRGTAVQPMSLPPAIAGTSVTAVLTDDARTTYLLGSDDKKNVRVARSNASGGWDSVITFPVKTQGDPIVTVVARSPAPEGHIWMALRDRGADGREVGIGVVEVDVAAARAIHHRAYRAGEKRPPEALPIVGDVRAVRFQAASDAAAGGRAMWFCTSGGVLRFAAGDLTRWGENEGLASESCHDLAFGGDGIVWAATEDGVARFDGKLWRDGPGSAPGGAPAASSAGAGAAGAGATAGNRWPVDREGDALAARALLVEGGRVWAATARGVWPVTAAGRPIDKSAGLIDDDIVGLDVDRFGRLWLLGHAGVTLREMPR